MKDGVGRPERGGLSKQRAQPGAAGKNIKETGTQGSRGGGGGAIEGFDTKMRLLALIHRATDNVSYFQSSLVNVI